MASKLRISAKQRKLFALLCQQDVAGRTVTRAEIIGESGYAISSFNTNLGKGFYARFLSEVAPDTFKVSGTQGMTIEEFVKLTTQSHYLRDQGYACRSPLAAALLRKSRDNMVLALEIYNRPSLENRLDAFVLLFCAAWEQLLKARIIEREGEEAIFKKPQRGRHRETIGLAASLEALFPAHDLTRKNLERVKYLRDRAAHLTMPEVQGVASRLFQSGVLNFAREFRSFAGEPFVPGSPVGLLTLVVDTRPPEVIHLKGAYGDAVGAEVLDLVRKLQDEIEETDDSDFAVPLEYSLVFSKEAGDADIILSKATGAAREAVVVVKTKRVEDTHPHTPTDVVNEVSRKLRERLRPSDLEIHLPARKDGVPVFNSYDLEAVLQKEGWKRSDNKMHHLLTKRPELRRYSPEAVDVIVDKIVADSGYLKAMRARLLTHRRRLKKQTP